MVDHPEIASYFTPLAICVNLDSFDYLSFDTTSDDLVQAGYTNEKDLRVRMLPLAPGQL